MRKICEKIGKPQKMGKTRVNGVKMIKTGKTGKKPRKNPRKTCEHWENRVWGESRQFWCNPSGFFPVSHPQLKVLPRDLQLCSETASGVDVGEQHEWGELVQLDPQTVGVIVRLERETFQVRPPNPTKNPPESPQKIPQNLSQNPPKIPPGCSQNPEGNSQGTPHPKSASRGAPNSLSRGFPTPQIWGSLKSPPRCVP